MKKMVDDLSLCSYVFLCAQLELEPVYECGRWKAYITNDIFIDMWSDESLRLNDTMGRINDPIDSWPQWMRDCPQCCRHVPGRVFHAIRALDWDLATLLEQVGAYLDFAPRAIPVGESLFCWVAKQHHNCHLTLWEKLFGPTHKYYDLYPGLFRGLWYKLSGKDK